MGCRRIIWVSQDQTTTTILWQAASTNGSPLTLVGVTFGQGFRGAPVHLRTSSTTSTSVCGAAVTRGGVRPRRSGG